jgi:hypothetical protein
MVISALAELMRFGPILRIAGIPIRPWEAIAETETQVKAA